MASNTDIVVGNMFTFTWRIENFNYCFQKKDAALVSPHFTNEGKCSSGTWRIELYPRGRGENTEDVACSLLYDSSDEEEIVPIKYHLGILGDPKFLTESPKETVFMPGMLSGFSSLISRKMLFRKKDLYLPNDTLTIQCQIWEILHNENRDGNKDVFHENLTKNAKRPKLGLLDEEIDSLVSDRILEPIGCHGRSCISVLSVDFEYFGRIECNKFASVIIKSPSLLLSLKMVDFEKKQILICIRRMEIDPSKQRCGIRVQNSDSAFASCHVRLIGRSKKTLLGEEFDFFYNDQLSVWEIFLNTASVKFEDDTIHLSFEYSASTGEVKHDVLHWNCETMSPHCPLPQIKTGEMCEFYLKKKHCDLKLVCADGQDLHAHKLILSVGSPIFKAMFDHDTKENRKNTVTIVDLSSGTMDLLLKYLYSGQYPDLEWYDALQLHAAANKYQVSKLADHCGTLMRNQLAVGNVCEILLQADRCHNVELKSAAQEFACLNLTEVFRSEGWKCLHSANSELSAEFLQCVSKKFGKQGDSTI